MTQTRKRYLPVAVCEFSDSSLKQWRFLFLMIYGTYVPEESGEEIILFFRVGDEGVACLTVLPGTEKK